MGIRITITHEPRQESRWWQRFTRRSIATALAATVVMLAAGGVAIASIPDAGTGIFHGCYSTSTGALRLINPSAHEACKAGEHAVSWNETGITWEGTWSPTTAYSVHDAVVYDGSSYIAKLPSTGKEPPNNPHHWSLLAAVGSAWRHRSPRSAGIPGCGRCDRTPRATGTRCHPDRLALWLQRRLRPDHDIGRADALRLLRHQLQLLGGEVDREPCHHPGLGRQHLLSELQLWYRLDAGTGVQQRQRLHDDRIHPSERGKRVGRGEQLV